jgi:DNA-directed RNA polymerase I, II, and III subunit RPABC5
MIIPIKCFTCGNVIANKYRFYQQEVRKRKLAKKFSADSNEIDKVVYLTKEFHDKTPEGEVLDELKMKKMCCRRHFLTHVDIE